MRSFSKPAIDVPAQLELLKRRGLLIQNEARAEAFLRSVSFFRLSPYMRPLQHPDDIDHRFRNGSQFRQLTRLYDFDRRLRLLTMDAIERVEIASRAVISNHMGPAHGSHWHINVRMFHPTFDHQRLLANLSVKQSNATRDYQRECERIDRLHADDKRKTILKRQRARENYARHYPATYADPPLMPGWAMLEELTLGDLSHLYKGLAKDADKKAIAKRLGLAAPLMQSWLHALTIIRNICAHHSRMWNRELGIRPELPKKAHFPWPEHLFQPGPHTRIFTVLCILNHLMHQVSPPARWDQRLYQLVHEFPEVSLKAMGFPTDWYQDPFWHALRG
ncbi:Abortive infection bacteriophage resistance protein [Pseudomonas cedrina]|uniref:DNA-binding protein n=2 Tax=Pseudomonas cedrina TaxID=651740 RepID=A0A1V2K587_PSECE|nr:Abi family protein [Pseudomonas cedrina]ONH52620.1 DNA-binding protein [Pseudomonas cedrina subsp. cedrina]SDT46413.1 Abortive infection bacteriophage resistance protein [Pseudomonas cedrina]